MEIFIKSLLISLSYIFILYLKYIYIYMFLKNLFRNNNENICKDIITEIENNSINKKELVKGKKNKKFN